MRKRSKYRPRGVNPQAHLMALQGACKLALDDQVLQGQRVALALDVISRGQGTEADWREVFDAVNVAEELVRMRLVPREAMETILAVQTVVVTILDRQRATGTRALRAAELTALRAFAADWAGLVGEITHQELFRAQMAVAARVRRVLAGNVHPGERVVEAVQ